MNHWPEEKNTQSVQPPWMTSLRWAMNNLNRHQSALCHRRQTKGFLEHTISSRNAALELPLKSISLEMQTTSNYRERFYHDPYQNKRRENLMLMLLFLNYVYH